MLFFIRSKRITKNRVRRAGLLLFCLFLVCPSPLHSQSDTLLSPIHFKSAYKEGKKVFLLRLEEQLTRLPLLHSDRILIRREIKKSHGLYEHLMNFYYYTAILNPVEKTHRLSRVSFLRHAKKMADEWVESIQLSAVENSNFSLHSLLQSTGYFSRRMDPIFRRFLRPIAKQIRGHWAFSDLDILKAQSVTRGKNITLAVIDSGVDPTIKEIKSQISRTKDFLDGSMPLHETGRFPYDWGGHGTSIASVVSQIAPKVNLLIIKFYDENTMGEIPPSRWTIYSMAAGLVWAVQNGADIINLSAAVNMDYEPIRKAVEYCRQHNVVVISPIGNLHSGTPGETVYYPAAYPSTIAVGGIEKIETGFQIWEKSDSGRYIDIVAPAEGFLTETPSYLDTPRSPRYFDGNSLAASIVAGTTALILSALDESVKNNLKQFPGKLPSLIKSILHQSASNERLGFPSFNHFTGHGLINVKKAVDLARLQTSPLKGQPPHPKDYGIRDHGYK